MRLWCSVLNRLMQSTTKYIPGNILNSMAEDVNSIFSVTNTVLDSKLGKHARRFRLGELKQTKPIKGGFAC